MSGPGGEQPDPLLARVVERAFPGAMLERAWPLAGGISAAMTAVALCQADGSTRRAVIRRPGEASLGRNPRAARDEYRVLELLRPLGLGAPAALYLDESGAVLPGPYLVMEYLAGSPVFAVQDIAGITRQAAGRLAAIHAAAAGVGLSGGAPACLKEHPGPFDSPPFELPAGGEEMWQAARIRARLAEARPAHRANPPVLLHGDYWPGNLLWREGTLAGVIDWEDACLGDPLADLAIARLDWLWIFGREAMQEFSREYFSHAAVDPAGLPAWDLWAVLRLARLAGPDLDGWAAFFAPHGRADISAEKILGEHAWFVAQAF